MFALLLWAAIVDLRERRIPNWLTFTLMLGGLMTSLLPYASSQVSFTSSSLGLLVGFAIPFILFAMGALGGGDVKLLAGVGAWIGPSHVFYVFLVAAVIGMVIVVTQCIAQGRLRALLRNSTVLAVSLTNADSVGMDTVSTAGMNSRSVEKPLPYAVPVLLATVAVVLLV
jgi:prepilin peptidase CpaA